MLFLLENHVYLQSKTKTKTKPIQHDTGIKTKELPFVQR